MVFLTKSEEDRIFKEAVIGYGFEEVDQTADGLYCQGCGVVHKRPTKMYTNKRTQSSLIFNEAWCRHAVVRFFNPEEHL